MKLTPGQDGAQDGHGVPCPYWLAVKAASREIVSPSGLVMVTRCAPVVRAGVTTVRVFMSLNVAVALLPPIVTAVPLWKPLPRIVSVVPPAAEPCAGFIVPIPNGTFASVNTVTPAFCAVPSFE